MIAILTIGRRRVSAGQDEMIVYKYTDDRLAMVGYICWSIEVGFGALWELMKERGSAAVGSPFPVIAANSEEEGELI